jgi:hypothetical protein
MMLDADIVAVSPSSVYRVLKAAGKLAARGGEPSRKGQGFEQPCGLDPSADPGAKTGVGGTMPPLGIPGLARMR